VTRSVSRARRVASCQRVEDAAAIRFDYEGFTGSHYSGWCITDIRAGKSPHIETERGVCFDDRQGVLWAMMAILR